MSRVGGGLLGSGGWGWGGGGVTSLVPMLCWGKCLPDYLTQVLFVYQLRDFSV